MKSKKTFFLMIFMNVDELDQVMRGLTGSKDTKQPMRVISHWIKKIRDSKDFTTYDEAEMNSILKLVELKLVEVKEGSKEERIGTVHVALTQSGQDLYKDFFKTGYFLKA